MACCGTSRGKGEGKPIAAAFWPSMTDPTPSGRNEERSSGLGRGNCGLLMGSLSPGCFRRMCILRAPSEP